MVADEDDNDGGRDDAGVAVTNIPSVNAVLLGGSPIFPDTVGSETDKQFHRISEMVTSPPVYAGPGVDAISLADAMLAANAGPEVSLSYTFLLADGMQTPLSAQTTKDLFARATTSVETATTKEFAVGWRPGTPGYFAQRTPNDLTMTLMARRDLLFPSQIFINTAVGDEGYRHANESKEGIPIYRAQLLDIETGNIETRREHLGKVLQRISRSRPSDLTYMVMLPYHATDPKLKAHLPDIQEQARRRALYALGVVAKGNKQSFEIISVEFASPRNKLIPMMTLQINLQRRSLDATKAHIIERPPPTPRSYE